jgi:hypothetical protein
LLNAEGTGPSGYAIGFPLPYAQPTGVTSMAYFFMPHIYALDVVLISGAISLLVINTPILNCILDSQPGRKLAISGTIALALAIISQSFVFSMDWFPVLSISTKHESLLDYRPALMIDHATAHSCSY